MEKQKDIYIRGAMQQHYSSLADPDACLLIPKLARLHT